MQKDILFFFFSRDKAPAHKTQKARTVLKNLRLGAKVSQSTHPILLHYPISFPKP